MKYSLFIGRYQPLHEGHILLIRTVLNEGKKVCIGLRDTPKTKDNPYSIQERMDMFYKVFGKEISNGQMVLCVLPDIQEVCYGRKVGWKIREIRLEKEIEDISATQIRKKLNL